MTNVTRLERRADSPYVVARHAAVADAHRYLALAFQALAEADELAQSDGVTQALAKTAGAVILLENER